MNALIERTLSFLSLLLVCFGIFSLHSCQDQVILKMIPTPCESGGEPNLHITNSGKALLSWVEYANDSTDALVYSTLSEGAWSKPNLIAHGNDWFVNWADFPSIVTYGNKEDYIAAHWLQKSAEGTYDYDIKIAQSLDGGKQWQPHFLLNQDGIAAEHGFVTMISTNDNTLFATWLDGRYTKTENDSDGHEHEHGGAMTLRGGFIHSDNTITGDIELDSRVCDCCQTSAARTSNGVIVAYRDRSEDEVRDITIVRQVGFDWTQPRKVFEDNWEIAGCPVNGPKIIAEEDKVAIAWFTMANDTAQVKVAFSEDAGASFSTPFRVDEEQPLGRVDIAFKGEDVVVSWLEQKNKKAEIRYATFTLKGEKKSSNLLVKTSPARSSGFPIMERYGDQLLFAWTEITDEESETTIVRTALVD